MAEALQLCGLAQGPVHRQVLLGQEAWLLTQLDAAEVTRRQDSAVSYLDDRDLLRALHKLPMGEPVARFTIPAPECEIISAAPRGVITDDGTWVTRLVGPPVRVQAAVVVDSQWSRGLDRASTFAGLCPRLLLLTAGSDRLDPIDLTEAEFYGIGVVDATGSERLDVLAQPDLTPKPFGPVSWRLAEQVFAGMVTAVTAG